MVKDWITRFSIVICGSLLISEAVIAEQTDPTSPLNWAAPLEVEKVEPVKKPVVKSGPKLQSIICEQTKQCRAVISNKVVVLGDSVNGYRVANINAEKVTLNRGSKTLRLFLNTPVKRIKY
ncbi:MAG: MSHA biogenesis protein MshK [Vibrio sp.]